MIKSADPSRELVALLSKSKARLVELLLERESKRAQEIKKFPREQSGETIRLPASLAQRRLWFLDQMEGGGSAYNTPLAVRLWGDLNEIALGETLDALVSRHEALRTVFATVDGDPWQEIAPEGIFSLKVVDMTGHDAVHREQEIELHKVEEAKDRFDLRAGPLIRGRLLRIHHDESMLLITMHHIVSDAWSTGVLIREFSELYSAFVHRRCDALQPLAFQYADYAQWQRQRLQGTALDIQLSYWRERLDGVEPKLELPTDRPRPPVQGHRGDNVEVVLDARLSVTLNALARRYGMTLFMILYAGWVLLLSRLSGQEDVVIGTPVANRRPEFEGLIGVFVNTLVLRSTVNRNLSIHSFLSQVKETTLGAYDHQDTPFERIVEALRPQRSLDRHPIFQVMFALQNAPQSEWRLPGLVAAVEDSSNKTSKFDLLLSLEERHQEIRGVVNYDSDLFCRTTIIRWVACFVVVLKRIVTDERKSIGDLPILPESELRQVTHVFNATRARYPKEKLIHEIFEDQVQRSPNTTAVVCEGQLLTYAELNGKANQLARYLRMQGATPGACISILMSRSLRMVVAELAVLKSGGFFVPVDPEAPLQRQVFIVRDCNARWILTEGVEEVCRELDVGLVMIELAKEWDTIASLSTCDLGLPLHSALSAYVMYTSGSTGVPKGVVVPHFAVNRLCINNGYARINPEDCIAHYSNPAFDASTFEIWGALLNGARVVVVPQSVVLDPGLFADVLTQNRVTLLWMSVGLFNQYVAPLAHVFARLRYLIVGGDRLEAEGVRRLLLKGPPQNLLNGYGPTECTTFSTTYQINAIEDDARSVPIGRPIANTQAYILDRNLQPVPIGVTGEIYIGGDGVASGYLSRPQLTGERFLANPFSTKPAARLYRTGDLGHWRSDGAIDFLGRNDHQVKIRGFRIEPGEIEAQLMRHERVEEALVVVKGELPEEKRLVAYVVPSHDVGAAGTPSVEDLRKQLKAVLPEHMVPSAFVILERMPLTRNGKPDRHGLPAPGVDLRANNRYEPPHDEVEAEIACIWKELLQVGRVGADDNFFELGGHSMLAIKALFRLNDRLGCSLRATDIYNSPTVQELASRIREGKVANIDFVDLSQEAVLDDGIIAGPEPGRWPAEAVMLTGGTGFVGRFLLVDLLRETNATVHCLVRAASQQEGMSRLRAALKKWDLWCGEFESRVVAIVGDLRRPRFGIDESAYEWLCWNIDTIYHCATSMNHLETYAMAKPTNVDATAELLRVATRHKTKVFNYVSTLSVFSQLTTGHSRTVSEDSAIDDERHSSSSGYAASKWVGEKMCIVGAERSIPCNIFRLGLVWADAHGGRYDELQRDYRIFKSCILSGIGIKGYRYENAPTPVDHVARAIVQISKVRRKLGIFHIGSSPQIIEDVFERCNKSERISLALVSFYDWICEMKRLHQNGQSVPAVPLVEYAFSLDEASFNRNESDARAASVKFDCAKTFRELERAGISPPIFHNDLLLMFLERLLSRDKDCGEMLRQQENLSRGPT